MGRHPQDVTETEMGVLQLLWDKGASTVRQLADQLYPDGGVSAFATVQKLLERLEDKEMVKRRKAPGGQQFYATMDRDTLIGRRLRQMAEQLCDGSLTPLLTQLVRQQKWSAKERSALRGLLRELEDDDSSQK